MENVSMYWSVLGRPAEFPYVAKTFLDTINMISVKLCMVVVLIKLYPF